MYVNFYMLKTTQNKGKKQIQMKHVSNVKHHALRGLDRQIALTNQPSSHRLVHYRRCRLSCETQEWFFIGFL
jgi:hypothetical protein